MMRVPEKVQNQEDAKITKSLLVDKKLGLIKI